MSQKIKLSQEQKKLLADLTATNHHSEALCELARILSNSEESSATQGIHYKVILNAILAIHMEEGYIPKSIQEYRDNIAEGLQGYFDEKDIEFCF